MVASREQGERKLRTANDALQSTMHKLDVTREELVIVKCNLQQAKEIVSEFKLTMQVHVHIDVLVLKLISGVFRTMVIIII